MLVKLIVEANELAGMPAAVRLRRCLKNMLRGYGIRVVSAEPVEPLPHAPVVRHTVEQRAGRGPLVKAQAKTILKQTI